MGNVYTARRTYDPTIKANDISCLREWRAGTSFTANDAEFMVIEAIARQVMAQKIERVGVPMVLPAHDPKKLKLGYVFSVSVIK